MKKCLKCGNSYSSHYKFCIVDGEELIATESSKVLEAKTKKLPKGNSASEDDDSKWDMAGYYIQERDEENTNAPGENNKHIRSDAVNTIAIVFFSSETGKWQIIEITLWKYYWARDLNDLKERFLISSSKAQYVHKEYGRENDGGRVKILMTGHRDEEGTVGVKPEPLSGSKKLIAEIHEALKIERDIIRTRYKESRTKWSLDECGNLIKEKSYGPNEPVKIEKFIRQF
jgi:hypothetical protein